MGLIETEIKPNSNDLVQYKCSGCGGIFGRVFIELLRSYNRQCRYTDGVLCNECNRKHPAFKVFMADRCKAGAKKISKEQRSLNSKKAWENAEYREASLARQRAITSSDEFKEKVSRAVKEKFSDPEYNQKIKEARKKYWDEDHYRANKTLTSEEFIKKAKEVHGDRYDYTDTNYKNFKTSVVIKCKTHGYFAQRPSHHISYKNGCPSCANESNSSAAEDEIIGFIKEQGNFIIEKNNRDILPFGYELDIFIPEKKLAIEYHGIFWHSYNNIETSNQKYKFQRKADLAASKDIKLLQFYDYEWLGKQDIMKSMIKHSLGLSNRIYARKCELDYVSKEIAADFFATNHMQGAKYASINIGLFYQGVLVSCISFSQGWEISRFASLQGLVVVGGLSRMLNFFKKNINHDYLFTYVDRRFSLNAEAYVKAGMTLIGKTKPNYRYTKNNRHYDRRKFQKHKLPGLLENFNSALTEAENMFNNGYRRYWDAGHYKLAF